MSAPYTVHAGDCAGPVFSGRFDTLDAAIAKALELYRPRAVVVTIYGGGYDVDCDDRGYYVCDDGLSDDEREAIEGAGLWPGELARIAEGDRT